MKIISMWDEVFRKLMRITERFRHIGEIRKLKQLEKQRKELFYICSQIRRGK